MPPAGQEDHLHGTTTADAPEAEHLAALRARLDTLGGEDMRRSVLEVGVEESLRGWKGLAEGFRIERERGGAGGGGAVEVGGGGGGAGVGRVVEGGVVGSVGSVGRVVEGRFEP